MKAPGLRLFQPLCTLETALGVPPVPEQTIEEGGQKLMTFHLHALSHLKFVQRGISRGAVAIVVSNRAFFLIEVQMLRVLST
jgi:hypothetical protein